MGKHQRSSSAASIGNLAKCLVTLSMLGLGLFAGSVAAGSFTVDVPSSSLEARVPVTLTVSITGADDVAGFQLYIDDGGTASYMHIREGSEKVDGLYLNVAENKAVLYPDDHEPLTGTVELFSVDVTPADGKNVQLTFDIAEVIDSDNDDVTDQYPGTSVVVPVTNGVTATQVPSTVTDDQNIDWLYDPAQGLTPADPETPTPWSSSSSQAVPTSASSGQSTKKSPGFLPLTLVSALASAGIVAYRMRRNLS